MVNTDQNVTHTSNSKFISLMKRFFGEELPIQMRFFNIVFSIGFIFVVLGVINNIALGSSYFAVTTISVFAFFMPAIFFFANYSKRFPDQLMAVGFISLDFFVLPVLFLTCGGVDSGMPTYLVLGIALTLFIIKGSLGIILGILDTIWCILLLVFSYYKPNYVYNLYDDKSLFIDISTNVIIVAIAISLIARVIFGQFQKERNAVIKLARDLEDMSVKDPLTTAYNRRFLVEFLQSEMNFAWESKKDISIIMIDIDKFKNLNDTYGHLVGDEVLINLTKLLKSKCRDGDIVARYGGEEFLLVLPGADKSTAAIRAEEIRFKVESSVLSRDITGNVTISLGVAQCDIGFTCEKFIENADKNLYIAKQNGRNMVCSL